MVAKKRGWFDEFSISKNINDPNYYAGKSLNLPAEGAGSLAGNSRRMLALLADWFLAILLARIFATNSNILGLVTLLIWSIIGVFSILLFGFTPGQFFCKLRTNTIRGNSSYSAVALPSAFIRILLLILVIPALITDQDQRGLQDRLSNTAIVLA